MRLYCQEPIKASYHSENFGGYSYSDSGVKMILVDQVILQDHLIKESCGFIGENSS